MMLAPAPKDEAAPLLLVEGLTKHFVAARTLLGTPREVVRAVDGVSFAINPGETLALVGESGCGKSTVGRLVLRLIEPTAGLVAFAGNDLSRLSADRLRAFRAKAQLIFQDPYASLNPRMTVGAMLSEPLLLHTDLSRGDRKFRVGDLLATVGLRPDHADRYPHEFSGGQRQRIAIARALAANPQLIVCDEPVSALDVSIRSQVLNLLRDLQQRMGLAYLFISHDLAVVRHIATEVAVMYLGRIVERARPGDLYREPRHPYTQGLLSAIPVPSPERRAHRLIMAGELPSPLAPPPGCHLHPRCPHARDRCRTDRPTLEADGAGHETACHFWPEFASADTVPDDSVANPVLERLIAAFDPDAGPRGPAETAFQAKGA
jgi:peptide/nickel transport system ATP-binding protein/oligopeptide transport system ATP-binding protein